MQNHLENAANKMTLKNVKIFLPKIHITALRQNEHQQSVNVLLSYFSDLIVQVTKKL